MKNLKTKKMALKPGVLALAIAFSAPQWAYAQQAPAAPLQKVTVTGSNIKRVAAEGPSPVQVITAKDIKNTGANTVAELLQSIPAFGTGASNDIVDGGFARGTSTASLRGLGADSTLVLLNGRRITASAYADPNTGRSTVYDLNSFPISAIERIEILKDGASAVYGSDAIAGVINFITKNNYQGAELGARYTANDDNEFGRKSINGIVGFGDLNTQRWNVWVNFDLSRRDSTKIKDVKDIHVAQLADVNARLNPFSSSLSGSPIFFRERTPGARNFSNNFARRADVIATLNCPESEQLVGSIAAHNLTATDTLVGRRFCNYNIDNFAEAQGKGEDANVLSKGTFKLSDTTEVFTELGYIRNERDFTGAPRAFRSTTSTTTFSLGAVPASQFQVILPVGHPDNPFTAANGFTPSRAAVGLRWVNSQGGSRNVNEAYRVLAGIKGTTAKWDWETAVLWNRSEREETGYGFQHRPTIERIFTENRTLAATLADPSATRDVRNKGFAQITQFDARASTEFGKLGGGAIGLAIGGEFRKEEIGLTPDILTQRGDIVGLVNQSIDGERNVKSAFIEFSTPFTKDLEMQFALRHDKYPTFKGSNVPKVGLKWTITPQAAIRSTYAEGFRAPGLTQVSPGGVQSFTTVTDSIRCPDGVNPLPGADNVDCNKGISNQTSANPNLLPERSKSYSFGLILNPTKNLDVLIDYFRIDKRAQTDLQSSQFVIDHPDQFPGQILRDNDPANLLLDANGRPIPNSGPLFAVNTPYFNSGSTSVSGIDLEVAFRKALGENGKLDTKLTMQYLLSFKRAERDGDARLNVAGSAGGIADWATSTPDQPRIRARLDSTWTRGVHALNANLNFVSSISLLRRTENRDVYAVPYCHYGTGQPSTAYQLGGLPRYSNWQSDCKVKSWTRVGVSYAYTGIKNTTLNVNIQNLFDTEAPYDPRSAVGGFNTGVHNGFGRYFQVSANYKFF